LLNVPSLSAIDVIANHIVVRDRTLSEAKLLTSSSLSLLPVPSESIKCNVQKLLLDYTMKKNRDEHINDNIKSNSSSNSSNNNSSVEKNNKSKCNIFYCESCSFQCTLQSRWKKHISSQKHQKSINSSTNIHINTSATTKTTTDADSVEYEMDDTAITAIAMILEECCMQLVEDVPYFDFD